MQPEQNIIATYNKVAAKYAAHFYNELDDKPLDRLLLRSFFEENRAKGTLIDLGCGPGQTTRFLADCGCENSIGTDLSPAMVETAKDLNPGLRFEVANMLQLNYPDDTFGSAVAFYAIVHFDEAAVGIALKEIHRVLKPGGQLLFSFHTGNQIVHLDELLEEAVTIDFHFFDVDTILQIAKEAGFTLKDALVRYPYAAEHPTQKAYIRIEK